MRRIGPVVVLLVLMLPAAGSADGVSLAPANLESFFVTPGEQASVEFRVDGTPAGGKLEFRVADYRGRAAADGRAAVEEGSARVMVELPRGYYTIRFPRSGQSFGLVALPRYAGRPDEFFCIDSAMSWLWRDAGQREDLVQILARCGIHMARERLSWGAINPRPDRWQWDAGGGYDTLRRTYREEGVDVLELFHSGPGWTGKIGPYPRSLPQTARSWRKIVEHWRDAWGALEVWNEPDIHFGGDLPADQYVPLVRTMANVLPPSDEGPALGGGVFAHFNPAYVELAARNGMLEAVDFVSFHTYGRAPQMEGLVGRFRDWLRRHRKASMPLWLTECGRPWRRGPGRPPTDQDAVSALDITMKAVEARACGVSRYFAFVYVFYEERTNNFGMMGRDGTPLRSMAAYAGAASLLAHADYLGDLRCDDERIRRARVFGRGDRRIVVLYTGEPGEGAAVELPIEAAGARGIDGRRLEVSGRRVPVPDGLTYVRADRSAVAEHLRRDTDAMRLYRLGRAQPPQHGAVSPVVLQHVPDLEAMSASSAGYQVSSDPEAGVQFRIRAVNLSDRSHRVALSMDAAQGGPRTVRVGSMADAEVTFRVPARKISASDEYTKLAVSAESDTVSSIRALVMNVRRSPSLEGLLRSHPRHRRLPVAELDRWTKLAAGGAEVEMASSDGSAWRMKVRFGGDADRWVYPRFRLPRDVDLGRAEGMVLRARCTGPGTVRLILWEGRNGKLTGVSYLTPDAVIPADGEWHAAFVPFGKLRWNAANEPDPDRRLDAGSVRTLSVGMNSRSAENSLEVSHLYVIGRS